MDTMDLALTSDEDFLERLNIITIPREPKVYRERPDHFRMWRDVEFLDRFRLSKSVVRKILERIRPQIASPTNRNHAVTAESKLLITLRYYATGSFISFAGDFGGIHKSTASRIINRVSTALALLRPDVINFPEGEVLQQTKEEFFQIAKFPRCIGCLDCTHVKIKSPGGEQAEIYRNRKNFFSFNVQTICDKNLMITNIVARWIGSTHDSTIFNQSRIRARFENNEFGDSLILGDKGYGLKPYLMTPFRNPITQAELLYNESHVRTRNTVERSYGVWKRRFPILATGINLKLENVEAVIVATAVLHNIACQMRMFHSLQMILSDLFMRQIVNSFSYMSEKGIQL